MKKIAILLVVFALLLLTVIPAFAYTGIAGNARVANGSNWMYGGTITIFADPGGGYVPCGSGTIDQPAGTFNIPFTCTPQNFTNILVNVAYNPGPFGGQPDTDDIVFQQLPLAGNRTIVLNTDSTPTAVTLQDVSTDAASNGLLAVGAVGLLLTGTAVILFRRRQIN